MGALHSISDDRGDESFADDLNMGRGIVSGRVALLLRSTEIRPHRPNDWLPHSTTPVRGTPSPSREAVLRDSSTWPKKKKSDRKEPGDGGGSRDRQAQQESGTRRHSSGNERALGRRASDRKAGLGAAGDTSSTWRTSTWKNEMGAPHRKSGLAPQVEDGTRGVIGASSGLTGRRARLGASSGLAGRSPDSGSQVETRRAPVEVRTRGAVRDSPGVIGIRRGSPDSRRSSRLAGRWGLAGPGAGRRRKTPGFSGGLSFPAATRVLPMYKSGPLRYRV